VDARVEIRIDPTRGADDDDLVVGLRVERACEGVRRLHLALAGDELIESFEVLGERFEFGCHGGDEKFHLAILPGAGGRREAAGHPRCVIPP